MNQETVYVVDDDVSATRRSWDAILPGCIELQWDEEEESWTPERPQNGSIIVCHQVDGWTMTRLRELARDRTAVLFISLADLKPQQEGPWVYRVGRSVGRPLDSGFSDRLARFRHHLKSTGQPIWQLLEGSPTPGYLLAYYLLGLLGDDRDARDHRRTLRAIARSELQTLLESQADASLDVDAVLASQEQLAACLRRLRADV